MNICIINTFIFKQMIKNLLFDQGGVIVDLDRERCLRSLAALGMREPEQMIGLYVQSGPFEQLESGKIGAAGFHAAMRPLLPAGVSDEQIDEALNSFIVGIPEHRLRCLERLRHELHYNTYILSNTNPIMFEGILKREFEKLGHSLDHYFDGVVTSYEAKSCKPDREIFDYAIRKLKIRPEETLFFDDGQANLDAAKRLGFRTALVAPGEDMVEVVSGTVVAGGTNE